jgi:hypothetical protein
MMASILMAGALVGNVQRTKPKWAAVLGGTLVFAVALGPVRARAHGSHGHGAGHTGHSGHSIGHMATGHFAAPPHMTIVGPGAFHATFGRNVVTGNAPGFAWHGPGRAGFDGSFGPGHGGHCYFSHHHHRVFGFFFVPLLGFGYGFPSWYDYPYVVEPAEEEPDISEFEPYYTSWEWSPEAEASLARYYVTPDSWLLVIVYPDQAELDYFYDPMAQRFVGVVDPSTGDFRHWLGDDNGWSAPAPFPDAVPPPLED